MAVDNFVPTGVMPLQAPSGEFNRISFIVQQALAKMQTATLVKIINCTNSGDISPVGFVDVLPLVDQIDGQGGPVSHTTIYNIPYLRIQGGSNAVIIDPEPGDIGVCVFASRDISKVKSTKAQSTPGSFRQYSFSDGMYLGGMLNSAPSQYVRFNSSEITIHSPFAVIIEAPKVEINASSSCTINTPIFTVNGATVLNGTVSQTGGGDSAFSGNITATGNVTSGGLTFNIHTHGGVEPGGGSTGGPQ